MEHLLQGVIRLRGQVELLAESAGQASREHHETWGRQKGLAASRGSRAPDTPDLERLRRHEMLYLGEAATLQWLLRRLDQLIAEAKPGPLEDGQVMSERTLAPSRAAGAAGAPE